MLKTYIFTEQLQQQLYSHLAKGGSIEVSVPRSGTYLSLKDESYLYVLQMTETNRGCALLGQELPTQRVWTEEHKSLLHLEEIELSYYSPVKLDTYMIYKVGKRIVRVTTQLN